MNDSFFDQMVGATDEKTDFDAMARGKPEVTFDDMAGTGMAIVDKPLSYSFTYDEVSEPYRDFIEAAEAKYELPKGLLANQIMAESDFDPKAKSKDGAVGISQIVSKYHPNVDPTDSKASISYNAKLLRKHYDKFGTWDKALAAYNMGPTNLRKYSERGLEETRNYLDKINLAKVTELETPVAELPTKLPTEPKVEKPIRLAFNIPLNEGVKYGLAKGVVSEAGLAGLYGKGIRGGGVTGEWELEHTDPLGGYEIRKGVDKPNLIKRGLSKLTEMLGSDVEPRLSEAARAQAVVQMGAIEEKIPLHEYRQSPELIEKAASSFVSMSSFGILPALRESLTGEVDFEPTNIAGYAGYGLGSAAGFFFGPITVARGVLGPAIKYLPRATQEGKLAARILKESLHDGILISVAGGLAQMGEAARSVTFSQAADQIWEGAKSGAVTGVVFGAARGMFPAEGVDKVARIVTGLIGLNAQRAVEVGGDPFTNRPVGEVVFDTLLDVLFLWNGLPKADFNNLAKSVDDLSKRAVDIDAAEKVVVNVQEEAVKQALDGILEIKKKQFELASEEFVKNLGGDVATAEEIMWESERLAREKVYPVERTGLKKPSKAQVRAITGRLPEGTEPDFVFTSTKGNEYVKVGKQWYKDRAPVTNTFVIKAAEKGKVKFEAVKPDPVELFPRAAYPATRPEPIRIESADKTRAINRMLREAKKEPLEEGAYIPEVDLERISTEEKINAIEEHYNRSITDISDNEIERFFDAVLGEPEPVADVDVQIGSRVVEDNSGMRSTFFTDAKLTEQRKVRWSDPYQIKSLTDSPEKQVQKLLNDANRWYKGDDSIFIDKVRDELTRLHTNAEDYLNRFDSEGNAYFDKPINHLYWKEHLKKAAEWVRNLDRLKIEPTEGPKLYSGLPVDEIKKLYKDLKVTVSKSGIDKLTPEQRALYKAGEWDEAFETARDAKKFKLKRFLDRAGLHTGRAIHERKMRLRRQLIKEYGADGHKILQYIDAGDAADGRADRMFYELRREAYKDVPSRLTTHVDAVDLKNRLKDIYGYKMAKEFNPPKGMGPEQTAAIDALLNVYKDMTPKERALAEKASKIMSDHVRLWVDDMVRVGLKSKEEGELLKSHDYRKIRSLNVENLYDQKYKIRVGDKLVRQSDSGVDPLGRNAITMVETDSRILYKETADRIYRRVGNQETKLKWREFDAKYRDNPFVIFKDNDKVLDRLERKVPKGWVRDFWYDNGERKAMYYHPDVALQLLSSGPHISFPLTRILTTALGINLTRSLAVGTSALWATTRGITMDLGHTFFSGRSFDAKTGKFKRTYSKLAPKYLGQIGRDMGSTFYDVITRGEKTGVYEKNGGSMPFLAMREVHFTGRGVKPPGAYSKLLDGLSFWSQSMERWNRVSVMERSLRQQAKKAGITLEEAYKNRDMTMEAVNVAVERLPYRQGGWLVKEVDKIFGPFISASYNAARTFLRGGKENPVDFTARIANIAVPTVGMTIAMTMYASQAKRDTPEWQHISGPVFTLFPDSLNFIDEEGNTRWINIRVPTDPMVAAFYNVFRGLTNKMLYEAGMTDVEPNYEAIVDSITRSLPMDTPLSPTMSAYFTYFKNIDVWRNQKVVDEAFDWPKSGEEGQRDPELGQLAKDVGKVTGLSPKRLKAAGRQLGLQSNEITWAMGKFYDLVNSDIDPRLRRQHWAITISKTPGLRNLMSVTVPRAYRSGDRKEMKQAEAFDSMLRREELDSKTEGYYWKNVGKESEIDKFIDGFEEEHIRKSLEKRRAFTERIKYLPHRSSWNGIYHTTPEYKAEDFYKIWKVENSPDERLALEKELDELLESGYVGKGSEDRFFETLENFKYRQE